MKRATYSAIIVSLLLLVISGLSLFAYSRTPAPNAPDQAQVIIPRGSTFKNAAKMLSQKGIIRSPGMFKVLAMWQKADFRIKSGEYHFTGALTPLEVLDKLVRGEVVTHPVTVPEGSSLSEIAAILENAGFGPTESLLLKARDPKYIKSLGIEESSLEGFLFPDTYRFSRETDENTIIKTMAGRMLTVLSEEKARSAPTKFSDRELLTLASLIEEETAKKEEKPLVAAVFLNRLKKRMRLECDPTVLYGVRLEDPDFKGRLRRKHLRKKTPYNTYRNFGLPPGPISNPGRESIRAVLNPASVDYLYFVSMNNGTHKFSKTLREHNGAVNKYQRKRRSRKK